MRVMSDTGLREVAESIGVGDKVSFGVLDFEFTVYEVLGNSDDEFVSIFGKKEHHPEDGLFTRAEFGVDDSGNVTTLLVRVYTKKDWNGELVDEKRYQNCDYFSVVE